MKILLLYSPNPATGEPEIFQDYKSTTIVGNLGEVTIDSYSNERICRHKTNDYDGILYHGAIASRLYLPGKHLPYSRGDAWHVEAMDAFRKAKTKNNGPSELADEVIRQYEGKKKQHRTNLESVRFVKHRLSNIFSPLLIDLGSFERYLKEKNGEQILRLFQFGVDKWNKTPGGARSPLLVLMRAWYLVENEMSDATEKALKGLAKTFFPDPDKQFEAFIDEYRLRTTDVALPRPGESLTDVLAGNNGADEYVNKIKDVLTGQHCFKSHLLKFCLALDVFFLYCYPKKDYSLKTFFDSSGDVDLFAGSQIKFGCSRDFRRRSWLFG